MSRVIARWNPERDVWETDQADLFSGHSDVFSETWPRSGTWAAGTAYELPTSAHRTDDSASSSSPSLPTPRATRGGSSTETAELLAGIDRAVEAGTMSPFSALRDALME